MCSASAVEYRENAMGKRSGECSASGCMKSLTAEAAHLASSFEWKNCSSRRVMGRSKYRLFTNTAILSHDKYFDCSQAHSEPLSCGSASHMNTLKRRLRSLRATSWTSSRWSKEKETPQSYLMAIGPLRRVSLSLLELIFAPVLDRQNQQRPISKTQITRSAPLSYHRALLRDSV